MADLRVSCGKEGGEKSPTDLCMNERRETSFESFIKASDFAIIACEARNKSGVLSTYTFENLDKHSLISHA